MGFRVRLLAAVAVLMTAQLVFAGDPNNPANAKDYARFKGAMKNGELCPILNGGNDDSSTVISRGQDNQLPANVRNGGAADRNL